jgi:hypothetical protein
MTRRCARAQARQSGRRGRSSGTAACCEYEVEKEVEMEEVEGRSAKTAEGGQRNEVESNMRRGCVGKATSRATWCLGAWAETRHGRNEA